MNNIKMFGKVANLEIKQTPTGEFLRLCLGTEDVYINSKGERVHSTEWHNVVSTEQPVIDAFRNLTDGDKAGISGSLKHRQYTDKEGLVRYMTEVVADGIITENYEQIEKLSHYIWNRGCRRLRYNVGTIGRSLHRQRLVGHDLTNPKPGTWDLTN